MDKNELRGFINRIIDASKSQSGSFNIVKAQLHLETLKQELVLENVPKPLIDYVEMAKHYARLQPGSNLREFNEDEDLKRVAEIVEQEKKAEAARREQMDYRRCYGC